MMPAFARRAQTLASSIRRLGYVYIPMGMNAAAWTPATEGRIRAVALSPCADAVLDQITVVSNLELRNAYTTGNHASSNCAFLSCSRAKRTEAATTSSARRWIRSPRALGGETPIPSLEIGTDLIAQVGNCDNGYACAYQNNLSWSSPTRRCRPRPTPASCSSDCSATVEARNADGLSSRRGSILDWMTSDLARLRRELGERSRPCGPYLDSVREVERRIQRAEQSDSPRCPISSGRRASHRCGKTTSG